MRTPSGIECRFFYGNYFRGKSQEECRLIGKTPPPLNWTADLCKTCPVPGIIRANACPNLNLVAKVRRTIFFLPRRVQVSAFCTKSKQSVSEPEIGCGQCHPLPFDPREIES